MIQQIDTQPDCLTWSYENLKTSQTETNAGYFKGLESFFNKES